MADYSEYSDVELYHKFHKSHVFKPEAAEYVKRSIRKLFGKKKITALEIGAGTGHHTKRISELKNVCILATEPDPKYFAKLTEYLKGRKNVKFLKGRAESLVMKRKFDIVLSFDSHHHIPFKNRKKYLSNIRKLLKTGGKYIIEDEIISDYKNNSQRINGLKKLHNFVIADSERKGNKALVYLERIYLKKAIAQQGEYKTSCKKLEKELSENGFKIDKKKHIGPAGKDWGVFVYVTEPI